jgi:hypothetical protein
MKKTVGLPALLILLATLLVACGATSEPTEPSPSQTPWIVVITTTVEAETTAAEMPTSPLPSATPAPTERPEATPTPTERAATGPTPTRTSPAATPTGPTATQESATMTPEPAETGAATTPALPTATNTPQTSAVKYPPPVLLDPPDNRPVSWKSTVLLKWSSVGELAADEFYHLQLEIRPRWAGDYAYGDYVYTKENQFLLEGAFLAPFHPPAGSSASVINWWVRVVRQTGQSEAGKPIGIDISPYSEERTLIIEPKTE